MDIFYLLFEFFVICFIGYDCCCCQLLPMSGMGVCQLMDVVGDVVGDGVVQKYLQRVFKLSVFKTVKSLFCFYILLLLSIPH